LELLKKSKNSAGPYRKGNSDMYLEVERLGVKDFFQDVIFHEGKKIVIYYDLFSH